MFHRIDQPGNDSSDTFGQLRVDRTAHLRCKTAKLVVGEDPAAPGFWLVGQGGVGIRASPAYGELLASQVAGAGLSSELVDAGVDPARFDPQRLRG